MPRRVLVSAVAARPRGARRAPGAELAPRPDSNWRPSEPAATPRVRVGGSAQWWIFYAQAGTLDVVRDARDGLYVGAGLRWRDPDLLSTAFWLGR